ncbi:hypothetical protein TNCV_3310211 [Trichonephila clavipes]|nr:hypothetical protein TNCV_3310211 [Trichonephila clavipes]
MLHSSDLNSSDFFWGHLKSLVYETPVATVEDITVRIFIASQLTSQASENPSSVGVGCAMTDADNISRRTVLVFKTNFGIGKQFQQAPGKKTLAVVVEWSWSRIRGHRYQFAGLTL